jgi:predicted butyrate kinase (DUF1464 family)
MTRVAGADPGTSSLDLVILADGVVADQCRFSPDELKSDCDLPVRWLTERGPFDLIAGPSGYGLSLVAARDCTGQDLALMSLVRPDEQGRAQGVLGFSAVVRALCASTLPVVFLPGIIHLATVPVQRKINRIDLGTPDKLCVAALALAQGASTSFCLVELGSAFTACVVVADGQVVDGAGGTSGPVGWQSGGAWDGELAYLLSPLQKSDLFSGGVQHCLDGREAQLLMTESVVKCVAGLQAVTPFRDVILSGRLLETQPAVTDAIRAALGALAKVTALASLPGASVKHAAQGAALLADGLAGGKQAALVERLGLPQAQGTVLSWLLPPRAEEVRRAFSVGQEGAS